MLKEHSVQNLKTQLLRKGTVRIGPAAQIPEILRTFGIDPVKIMDDAGLDLKIFDDPDNLISFTTRSHLIALCHERTGCNHLGLLLGKNVGLSHFGIVGYLAQHSPDVASALNNLVHHFHLHAQGSIVVQKVENDIAFFGYSIYQPGTEATAQLEDAAVTIMYNCLSSLCGPDWKPIEVCFRHRKPNDIKPFRRFFQTTLFFDAEDTGIFFDANYLQQATTTADIGMYRLLQKQIDQIEIEYSDNFTEQIRRILTSAIPMGHTHAEQIAALFSIHSRTLNRRLSASGTSFKKLADEVRFEISRQMLNNSDIEVREIAEMLHYSDASAFTKAFKRWSGTTPAKWRVKHRQKHNSSI